MGQRVGDRAFVTRGELKDIMQQILDNMSELSQGLMQDVNSMYRNHVFPLQIRSQVLEELLYEKLSFSKQDIDKLCNEKIEELQKKAKEMADKMREETAEEVDYSLKENTDSSPAVSEENNVIPIAGEVSE
jgi:hypothetical protein